MAFLCQYGRVLVLFVKLKGWKFLFMTVVGMTLVSNLVVYKPTSTWMQRLGMKGLQVIDAKDFHRENYVLSDRSNYDQHLQVLVNYVSSTGNVDFNENIRSCTSAENCKDALFQLLVDKANSKMVQFVDFKSEIDGRVKLICEISTGYELYCPYMAYLVGISQAKDAKLDFRYNKTNVFRLMDSFDPVQVSKPKSQGGVCEEDVNYTYIFPTVLVAQTLFVTMALTFYILISTVSTIFELKQNSFLRLMFRRRLSVLAYWTALWTVTLFEMAIFAAVLAMAYHFQCPAFYVRQQVIRVFLLSLLQFCCFASLCFLSTVLTRRGGIAALVCCFLCLVSIGVTIYSRFFFKPPEKQTKRDHIIRMLTLLMPFGHLSEQIFATLFQGKLPPNAHMDLVLIICVALLAFAVIAAVYLDIVLKSGNGLRFPMMYPFYPRFWRVSQRHHVPLEQPQVSSMIEDALADWEPTVCVSKLGKRMGAGCCCCQRTEALQKFTVRFYPDQINAIVGHNGSGKSILMQILSGERHATSGVATFNKLPITDPLCRYHVGSDIGYCPQTDALVDRMSVIDTLKLVAASAGLSWDDVNLDVKAILSTLLIEDKLTCSIGSLSSSDKRKVCVTMALIGKPKVILLDSPSTDMDFISKRRMWKLLHEYKRGRTIIFSTLFMDDADGIADRMIFISSGRVICAGSSFFFKRAFDCRYIIQIASKTEFHVPSIIRIITSKFPTIRVRSIGLADVEFEVSLAEDDMLPDVIQEVESLCGLIDEYGIATFCLDDVFSKFKNLSTAEIEQHFKHSTVGYLADDYERIMAIKHRPEMNLPDGPRKAKRASFVLRTTVALFIASCKQTWRSKIRFVFRVLVPCFLILLVIGGSVLETSAGNNINVRYNLSNTSKFETERGVCMHYFSYALGGSNHWESLANGECGRYISGKNKSNDIVYGLEMEVPNGTLSFVHAVLKYIPFIRLKCGRSGVPCPVLFSTDWCPDKSVSQNYEVYVGSYVNKDNYTAESVAMTAIEVFKNMVAFLTLLMTRGNYSIKADFDTEGITSVSSIFYRFYGLYIQIALLSVIPAICLVDVIQDKQSGVRRQLNTMGISKLRYWACTLLSHWIYLAIIYLICSASLILVVSVGYKSKFYLIAVMLPTLTFGIINSLLFVYVISMFAGSSYMCVTIYVFTSIIVTMSALIVQTDDLAGQIMVYVFPQYAAMAPTFYGTKFIYYSNAYYAKQGPDNMWMLRYAIMPGRIRDSYIALAAHFIVLIVLMVTLEKAHYLCCMCGPKYKADNDLYADCKEPTIVEEVDTLKNNPKLSDNIMEANHLRVVTRKGEISVKNLTFGLKFGEIFGLLGPNGSGKGAAVRAVVGDQRPSAGRVDFHVIDRWLSNESALMQGFIGYCPKYNPLVERLTVHENLQFYARAVGVPLERVQQIVRNFQLESEVNTIVMHATEAVKRRLSLAIAVLASPRMLVIDQATAGVDPEGRRIIWQTIKSLACRQRGMLIATQHMEEAETLCTRICILTAGMMAALNTIVEIVDKYRELYILELHICAQSGSNSGSRRLLEQKKAEMIMQVKARFYGTVVLEQFTLRMQFAIPIRSMGSLSNALRWLADRKRSTGLLYFALHYASIDQTMKAIVVHHSNRQEMRQPAHSSDVSKVIDTESSVLI